MDLLKSKYKPLSDIKESIGDIFDPMGGIVRWVGYAIEGLGLDLFIEDLVICEIKAVEQVNPVWKAQVLSHLKLTERRLGYVINFNLPLIKNGINRLIL